jgi:SAM-dependent methyltransferase
MSFLQRAVLNRFYAEAAGNPERLPWHRDNPDGLLARAAARRRPGRALDVGCGAGILASWLAELGYAVTAIDLHPEAVAMARARAAAGPPFDVIEADALRFEPDAPFDFILDSGCLHTLGDGSIATYRRRVLSWLAPDGDFVLEHWDRSNALDWRPIGPHRRSRARMMRIFAPDFVRVEHASEEFSAPMPIGPRVLGTAYHFRFAA